MDASSTMPGLRALKQERGLPSSLESPFGGSSLSKESRWPRPCRVWVPARAS